MAQKRFINYKDVLESFPLDEKNIGILKSGRYSGFDLMSSGTDLIINIEHSGLIKKTIDGGSQISSYGSFITPTGTIIHEEDPVTLTITDNIGNLNTRTDLIIAEHTYTQIQGGTDAIYYVIQGPNDGGEPVLTDDTTQTILTKVTIAPGGTTYADLTLVIPDIPLLGSATAQQMYDLLKALINAGLPLATETVKGVLQLATSAEGLIGTDTEKAITSAVLAYVLTNSNIVFDPDYVQTEENFTTTLRSLLLSLDPNAEPNVQSDWDATSGDALILNKPNIVEVLLQGRTTQAFNIDGGGSGFLSNIGFSSVYRDDNGDTSVLTFTFPNLGTDLYQAIVTVYTSGSYASNNQHEGHTVLNKTSTSFEWMVRETAGDTESLLIFVTLIRHV